jgi:hypothetical protein
MTKVVAKPMRSIRREAFALALMASVPVALALVFPYDALGFRPPRDAAASRTTCAFVALDADEERAALAAARSAWQVDSKSVAGLRIDLSSGDLPPAPVRTVELRRPVRGESAAAVPFEPEMLPPTFAAPSPRQIKPDAYTNAPAFPREELLNIA